MSSSPRLYSVHHSSGAWEKVGCQGARQNRAAKLVQMTGCFASDGWQMARFVLFYVALKIIGGEGMEKIENFLMTGFGKMLTLIHVEKNALFCKYKSGENATSDFFHAVLHMGIRKLCLHLLQVKHSAP